MATYTLFHNPMSRAQIARWALHEVDADYAIEHVPYENKPAALLEASPIAKIPVLVHHHGNHVHTISETAAICAYLADAEPQAGLAPTPEEKARYYRLMFFAAGPLEQAITANSMGWAPPPDKQGMAGFGNFERTVDMFERLLSESDYVCGDRFTMADVYVGAHVDWGMAFGSLPRRDVFEAYAERLRARPAYQAQKRLDNALIAEMQKDD